MQSHPENYDEFVRSLSADEFASLRQAVREQECRTELGYGTINEAIAALGPQTCCPICGSAHCSKDGKAASGKQRYKCKDCGVRFCPTSTTVFDYSKKDLPTWIDFIRLMCFNAPIEAIAEICHISHQTAFEWRHRVFTAVDGYQNAVILKDHVWIDGIDPVELGLTGLSLPLTEDGKKPSRKDQLVIAVAHDSHNRSLAVPYVSKAASLRELRNALSPHIDDTATVVHGHETIVGTADDNKIYGFGVGVAQDVVIAEGLSMATELTTWLKRNLWKVSSVKSENLQSYLNWFMFLFEIKRDDSRLPMIERIIRQLITQKAYFRSTRW